MIEPENGNVNALNRKEKSGDILSILVFTGIINMYALF